MSEKETVGDIKREAKKCEYLSGKQCALVQQILLVP